MQPAWRPLPVAADDVAAMSPVPLTPLVAALAPLPFSTVAFGNGDPALSTQSATGTPGPPHPAPSHRPTSGKWQRVELASGTGPRLAFRHHELVENAKPGGTWEWQPSSSGAQLAGSESHVPPPSPQCPHFSKAHSARVSPGLSCGPGALGAAKDTACELWVPPGFITEGVQRGSGASDTPAFLLPLVPKHVSRSSKSSKQKQTNLLSLRACE